MSKLVIYSPKELARMVRSRLRRDNDAVFCVSGDPGIGKTTLCHAINIEIDKNYVKQPYVDSLRRHIIFSGTYSEAYKKIVSLKKFSAIHFDEAEELFYRRDYAKKRNKNLNKVLMKCRKENKSISMALPRMKDLDEYLRNGRLMLWIYAIARGIGVVMVRSKIPEDDDPWGIKAVNWWGKKIKSKSYAITSEGVHSLFKKVSNYKGLVFWKPLEGEFWDEYVKVADIEKYGDLDPDSVVVENFLDRGVRTSEYLRMISSAMHNLFEEKKAEYVSEKRAYVYVARVFGVDVERVKSWVKKCIAKGWDASKVVEPKELVANHLFKKGELSEEGV